MSARPSRWHGAPTCREFVALFLPDWVNGTLPARRRRACAAHLAACRPCAEWLRGYRLTVRSLRALAAAAPPPLTESLVQAILRRAA